MISAFIAKILTVLMSLMITIGSVFGAFEKPTTKEPENYYDENIKNVIYLIGDGMGFNHLEKTKNEKNISLVMDSFDIKGASMTRSFSNKVTDSAAGGTALATGVRTTNGVIGAYPLDVCSGICYPKSITELCIEKGMMTGVITTDETSGATPASFSAHSMSRNNTKEITNDQLTSDIDIIWGAENGYVTKEKAEENGFQYVETYGQMMALKEGSRSFAQFENDMWRLAPANKSTPNLEQMAVKAVDLLDDTDEGFFLMIEGAHIDKHSHNNDSEKMTESVMEFDRTIKAMLEYAKADGETLVIVTADHETGGIVLNGDSFEFTKDDHTAANVPVLVYGTDKLIKSDEVLNNYEIPIRIAYILGENEDTFPVSVMTRDVRKKAG